MADPLYTVKSVYHIGAYETCIDEAADLDLSEAGKTERDFYVLRSHLALGRAELVIKEVADSAPMALQGVKMLAVYKSSPAGSAARQNVVNTVLDWKADTAISSNPLLKIMLAAILVEEGEYLEALKVAHGTGTLETMAIQVQVYLRLDRADLSEKIVSQMNGVDEDSVLTQLCQAWTCIALGGSKLMDAFYTFQELAEKYTWTSYLYTGCAVAHMKMGQWEEAERELGEALGKNPQDADALANAAVVAHHLGRATAAKLQQQLLAANPLHPAITRVKAAEALFDEAAAAAAASAQVA